MGKVFRMEKSKKGNVGNPPVESQSSGQTLLSNVAPDLTNGLGLKFLTALKLNSTSLTA